MLKRPVPCSRAPPPQAGWIVPHLNRLIEESTAQMSSPLQSPIAPQLLRPIFALAIAGLYLSCAAGSPPVLTFLRADGQDIVNERSEKVLLRGVGLGNWLLPE